MAECLHCGAELPEDAVFCAQCGKKTTGVASPKGGGVLFWANKFLASAKRRIPALWKRGLISRAVLIVAILILLSLIAAVGSCVSSLGAGISEWSTEMERSRRVLEWPDNELANQLPVPNSEYGYVDWSDEESCVVVLTRVGADDYELYVSQCKDKGFILEASQDSDSYIAKNGEGYRLEISRFEEDREMRVKIATPLYPVELEVNCRKGSSGSRYDLAVCLDGLEVGSLRYGTKRVFKTNLTAGDHQLSFESKDDILVEGFVELKISPENPRLRYALECHPDRVEVRELKLCPVPIAAAAAEGKNREDVKSQYTEAGFENVVLRKAKTLSADQADKRGLVESVSIGGKSDFEEGDEFYSDAKVVITSYDFKEIHPPSDSYSLEGKKQKKVVSSFEKAGFANVVAKAVKGDPMENRNGEVFNVSIGGESYFDEEDVFALDEKVVVSYYKVGAKGDKAEVPFASDDVKGRLYKDLIAGLKAAGFTNVKLKPIYDRKSDGWFSDVGYAEKVVIAGFKDYDEGDVFKKRAKVVVHYHDLVYKNPNMKWKKRTVNELVDDLEGNALKANEEYTYAWVQVTGVLESVEEDGTFYLAPSNTWWSPYNVQCVISTDAQKAKVMNMSKGQTVTVRGQITVVGDVLGYGMMVCKIL